MKASIKWLNEYVETPSDVKAFCDRLDLTGTGVEGVEELGANFDRIVTAQVISKQPHPDSDHMWVCQVDVGDNNLDEEGNPVPLQIVCGAQNFNEGDHIVTALIGAVLPGDFKIKKSKLRGVTSCGMNCSERELGLGSDHDGIMILPQDAPIGIPFAEYADMGDVVLDLEITPNRPDCLSVTGLAREIGAMYQRDWSSPLPSMAAKLDIDGASKPIDEEVTIEISDALRCPRYSARVIKGCKIGPSPDWLVDRLAAIGQRSINNVVDVTNYILYLFGQPLHAFDLNKLKGSDGVAHIVVRAAKEGEKLQTLDGEMRELNPDMTVIATTELGAVALAGVMGGMDTEITDGSVDILIEAATFEPGRTSRTSRSLGLISESSLRYERGVDDHGIDARSAAACALIVEVAGGSVSHAISNDTGIIDVWPEKSVPEPLDFRIPRFREMMGVDVPRGFIVDMLNRLGCDVDGAPGYDGIPDGRSSDMLDRIAEADNEVLTVVPPTYRPDLEREVDLFEEVLRLWGMDKVPSTLPSSPKRVGERSYEEHVRGIVDFTLRSSGLNETMTYSFVDADDVSRLQITEEDLGDPVELINPMSADQSVMRQTIIPGLLRSVAYNQHHGTDNIQLYEIGTVFAGAEGRQSPKERKAVAAVLAGAMHDDGWNVSSQQFDFFDGKGVVENLARELALPKVRFKPLDAEAAPHLQPGRAAEVYSGGIRLGWLGEIHPSVVEAFDANAPVVAFELSLSALEKASRPAREYVEVPEFPPVTVDQAFIVGDDVSAEKMVQVMTSAGGKQLESVRLFDVFRDDEKIGVGKKSMAFTLTYRAKDRTLTSDEVAKSHEKLVKKVVGATSAETRS